MKKIFNIGSEKIEIDIKTTQEFYQKYFHPPTLSNFRVHSQIRNRFREKFRE